MVSILHLPDEIHLPIANQLSKKSLYSLLRTCRSLYALYTPFLWPNVSLASYHGKTIDASLVRANAHLIQAATFSPNVTEEHYVIDYPNLRTLRMVTSYEDEKKKDDPQVLSTQKIWFIRLHPFVRKLTYQHRETVPREFWEVVEAEWTQLEELEFSGLVEEDALDAFWRVCDRIQDLRLIDVQILSEESAIPILSTLSFRNLQQLTIEKSRWTRRFSHGRTWPLQLLEQVKKSPDLRRLRWDVDNFTFPIWMVQRALAEEKGYWPALCELSVDLNWDCTDQDLAQMLRSLPSRRLTCFGWEVDGTFGPLTYNCLREMYFAHLRELKLGECRGVTSAMAQELLTKCIHLIHVDVPYIYVRDIAKAPTPWGCLNLERLKIYIAKEPEDEAGWEGKAFEQISRLRRLLALDLEQDANFYDVEEVDDRVRPHAMETLDLRLGSSSRSKKYSSGSGADGTEEGGGGGIGEDCADIRCWSSLVQLRELIFNGDRQMIGLEEALWMTEHWKDLGFVEGAFKGVDVGKLKKLFTGKGVTYYD